MKQTSLSHDRDDKVSRVSKEELFETHDIAETVDAGMVPMPEVIVIRSKKKADSLLYGSGFTKLVGVSYVASLSVVQDLFANGYEEIELVVGEDFSEEFKKELKGKDKDTVLEMARKVADGKLRLFFPQKKPDHSKLYILSKPGHVRLMNGSANLTESALMGDLIAAKGARNGWSGVVILGAIRDSAEIAEIDFGAKALGVNPAKSSKEGTGAVDEPVEFGGVTFTPGDWIYCDEDGILVAPEPLT